jgi:hypothetical protein
MALEALTRTSLQQFCILLSEVMPDVPADLEARLWRRIQHNNKQAAGEDPNFGTVCIPCSSVLRHMKTQLPFMPNLVRYEGCEAIKYNFGLFTPCGGKVKEGEMCSRCIKAGAKYGMMADRAEAEFGKYEAGGKKEIVYAQFLQKRNLTYDAVKKEMRSLGISINVPEEHLVAPEKEAAPKAKKGRKAKQVKAETSSDSGLDSDSEVDEAAKKAEEEAKEAKKAEAKAKREAKKAAKAAEAEEEAPKEEKPKKTKKAAKAAEAEETEEPMEEEAPKEEKPKKKTKSAAEIADLELAVSNAEDEVRDYPDDEVAAKELAKLQKKLAKAKAREEKAKAESESEDELAKAVEQMSISKPKAKVDSPKAEKELVAEKFEVDEPVYDEADGYEVGEIDGSEVYYNESTGLVFKKDKTYAGVLVDGDFHPK